MDKETARLLLASYRPEDALDPIFAEALLEVKRDPEFAAWFAEMQRFDSVMTEKFADLPVPPEVKSRVLLAAHADPPRRVRPRWLVPLGIAATVAFAALAVWRLAAPPRRADSLALQAINFTEQMPALQFVCFDASAVAKWVNKQPDTERIGLTLPPPAESLSMGMIGSSVVQWQGRPVVMLCLQNGQHMAMLYILQAGDAPAVDGASETVEKNGWAVRTTRSGGQVRILTAKGSAQDLNFPMPL